MELLTSCPVCLCTKFEPFISCIDYTVSRETFLIVKCEACGFIFTNPRPSTQEIGKYYQSEEYISHSGTKKGLINRLYHIARSFTLKSKYNIIKRFIKQKDIELLDIGCGTGEFLNYCKQKGMHTQGIEPG